MAFIDDMRSAGHAVESTCAVLTEHGCLVAARTYRAWRSCPAPAARTVRDAVIIDALLATEGTPESLYGRRKMTAFLRRSGHDVAYCTVDRLMALLGMNGVRRGKKVRTTVPGTGGQRAGDLLNRDFTAAAPNTRWVADFTYVRSWAGFVYVAFVVDIFAQRILGWHAATTKHTDLVLTCLRMATWQRDHDGHPVTAGELVHHSDAGSQYTSLRFTEHLALEGIAPSIGSVGDAYDNAMAESFFASLECELLAKRSFETKAEAKLALFTYIEGWYNPRRRHSGLGRVSPINFERSLDSVKQDVRCNDNHLGRLVGMIVVG